MLLSILLSLTNILSKFDSNYETFASKLLETFPATTSYIVICLACSNLQQYNSFLTVAKELMSYELKKLISSFTV